MKSKDYGNLSNLKKPEKKHCIKCGRLHSCMFYERMGSKPVKSKMCTDCTWRR